MQTYNQKILFWYVSLQKRKIDNTAKVLTNEEFSNLIKEKERKTKKTRTKPTKTKQTKVAKTVDQCSESSESEISLVYEDESDIENLTLEDLLEEEVETHADIQPEDFILFRKDKVKYYSQSQPLNWKYSDFKFELTEECTLVLYLPQNNPIGKEVLANH
ncbi:hypothetical protein FQA39_LY08056 [Lamprigera yunnana]|nr:hypothetical protein FQA39_LY08056 [Lamprigera yunnana]